MAADQGPILGISALFHDSAAALVDQGRVAAASQEERFSRIKHDAAMPTMAIAACLEELGVEPGDLGGVTFYEKPLTKLHRVMTVAVRSGPSGARSFRRSMPSWARTKLWVPYETEKILRSLGHPMPGRMRYCSHHSSHAASAFFPSPFESAAIIVADGVGEWATTSISVGRGNKIEALRQVNFPDSLGLLYSAFTSYCGFRVNSGEYKLMGLAPYGEPRFADLIRSELVDIQPDGAFRLDQRYFAYQSGSTMTSQRFDALFGGPPRVPESEIEQRHCDLAASVQVVLEEILVRIAITAAELTGEKNLCLAGGVALNCVANRRLLDEGPFDEIWIQPASGDAGGAVGAALHTWHEDLRHPRSVLPSDGMSGSLLGPANDPAEVRSWATADRVPHEVVERGDRAARVAALVASGATVGLVQGRMEFGPRALGNRSIIADPRDPSMWRRLNLEVKRRESFRPFAPAVLADRAEDWFELSGHDSPYMLLTAPVQPAQRLPAESEQTSATPSQRAQLVRSTIPAVTHVNFSARVQTVDEQRAPLFHDIITEFDRLTGCPVVINTSFNLRGEPPVCTHLDAYETFLATDLDALFIEDVLILKRWLVDSDSRPDGEGGR